MLVRNLMSTELLTCGPDDTLERAAQLMWDGDCGALPVVSGDGGNRAIGMLTDRDVLMCALFEGKPLRELRVEPAMAGDVRTCRADHTLAEAEDIMRRAQVRRLPVTDEQGTLLGMISLADIAREAARERGTTMQDIEVTETEVGDTLAAICARGLGGLPGSQPTQPQA